jgi:hypothetical protein
MTSPLPPAMRKLADRLQPSPRATTAMQLRQGVVTATAAGPPKTVTVQLGGETTPAAGARYLASHTPAVNDAVWVLVAGRTRLVLGKLA